MRYLRNTCMLSSQTKSEGCGQSNQILGYLKWSQSRVWVGSGWPKRCITSASLSAQLNGRASRAQIHTGCAVQFYTSAGISSLEFGAGSGKQRALFQHHIPIFQDCLPLTAPISTPRPPSEPEKYKLSNGVLRSGNGAVDAKLCLKRPI